MTINYGLKINESLTIKKSDIDWENEEIILQDRKISFSDDFEYKKLLHNLINTNSEFLFTTAKNEESTYDWAYYWWRKIMAEVGLNYTINQLILPS